MITAELIAQTVRASIAYPVSTDDATISILAVGLANVEPEAREDREFLFKAIMHVHNTRRAS